VCEKQAPKKIQLLFSSIKVSANASAAVEKAAGI